MRTRYYLWYDIVRNPNIVIDSETAMGTNINSQIGGNSEYVDAVVRVSDIIFSHIR